MIGVGDGVGVGGVVGVLGVLPLLGDEMLEAVRSLVCVDVLLR